MKTVTSKYEILIKMTKNFFVINTMSAFAVFNDDGHH